MNTETKSEIAAFAPPDDPMREALAEARLAEEHGDVPVGAVVVELATGRILGRGHNRREIDADPTAHAEVLAIRAAAKALGTWYLVDTALYVTHEPCPMCAGAILNARIPRLIYGCDNPKAGAVRSLYRLLEDTRLNHRVAVEQSPLAAECGELLTQFFKRLRTK